MFDKTTQRSAPENVGPGRYLRAADCNQRGGLWVWPIRKRLPPEHQTPFQHLRPRLRDTLMTFSAFCDI